MGHPFTIYKYDQKKKRTPKRETIQAGQLRTITKI